MGYCINTEILKIFNIDALLVKNIALFHCQYSKFKIHYLCNFVEILFTFLLHQNKDAGSKCRSLVQNIKELLEFRED